MNATITVESVGLSTFLLLEPPSPLVARSIHSAQAKMMLARQAADRIWNESIGLDGEQSEEVSRLRQIRLILEEIGLAPAAVFLGQLERKIQGQPSLVIPDTYRIGDHR